MSALSISTRPGTSIRPPWSSNTVRPERSGSLKLKLSVRSSLRIALDLLDLVEPLHARLGLAGLGGLGPEALDEPLQPRDLGLLLVDRLAQGDVAHGLLLAPCRPGAGEELGPARLQLQHRRAHRLQEPAVVGHQHDRGVQGVQVVLQPLQRRDVQVVGGLVQQQQVGLAGERAGQRAARQLTAGEGGQRAIQVLVAKAQAVHGRQRLVAPAVAAAQLEPLLRPRVGRQRLVAAVALGHRLLQPGQLGLQRHRLHRAREHVVAQRQVALARRALVVQRHLGALLEAELADVVAGLAGQDPQQRGLARAVAARQRHPVAPLELERHAPEQGLARHVLAQIGCRDHCHCGGRC